MAMSSVFCGLRHMASGDGIHFPVTHDISKYQGNVFSFRCTSLLLAISSRVWSPNSLTSGRWSVCTYSLVQPNVKNLLSSRAYAPARASSSIG